MCWCMWTGCGGAGGRNAEPPMDRGQVGRWMGDGRWRRVEDCLLCAVNKEAKLACRSVVGLLCGRKHRELGYNVSVNIV